MGMGVDRGSGLVLHGDQEGVALGLACQYSWNKFILPNVDFDTRSQGRINENK